MLSPSVAASMPIAAFAAAAFVAALVFDRGSAAADAVWRSLWIAGPMSLVIVAGVVLRDASPPVVEASAANAPGDARLRCR